MRYHDLHEFVIWLVMCTDYKEVYAQTHDNTDYSEYMRNQVRSMCDEWDVYMGEVWARVDSE